ncbi:amino acid adenylation domain-containing protein [Sphaerimonospora sp. CA-214678]|uniref:amino acid adenylation domain-containing protein n=1 Tax=Sphaerimonospora sp. CA-214678 TaxID=3240029 RepID=UPI003D8C51F6
MTRAQLGVWAAQHLDPMSPRYNCGSYVEIRGPLDEAVLRRAVGTALTEAEALRVRFDTAGPSGDPAQTVASGTGTGTELELLDLTGRPRAAAEEWMRADLSRPVRPLADPLVRCVLIREAPDGHLLYIRYHHLVMDGFGQTVYIRRIAEIYTALADGAAPPPTRALPLETLVAEDMAYAASAAGERDRAYWLDRFADRPDPVSLGRPGAGTAYGLLRRGTDLPPADTALLRAAARRLGVRPSALLIAAVAAYQCRITGTEETLLGIPLPARPSAAALATPAMFANELPVRFTAPRTATFAELVAHVSAELGQALRHQRYRGEELHRELLPGDRRRLAGTTVNVVTFDADVSFSDLPGTAHHLSSGPVDDLQFDFFADARGTRVRLNIDANPELHTAGALAAHSRRLLALLRGALADPDLPVGGLPSMDEAERRAVLAASAPDVRDYDLDVRLHELIEKQAARTPDAIAAQVSDASLTYRELVGAARRLAAHLGTRGVEPGAVVGIYQERSLDLVVSLLAVLMAGAAYLPLDPELPAARLEFQLRDAAVGTVLTTARLAGTLNETLGDMPGRTPGEGLSGATAGSAVPDRQGMPDVRVVAVDEVPPGPADMAGPPPSGAPTDTAYVIYTSGSTGTPKGVAVPHRGVVNRLLWMQEEYRLGPGDRVLQKTPFTFDVSVWEFFWPLLTGARLHLAEPGAHRDPRAVAAALRDHGITTVHFVPPMLDAFLAEPSAADLPALRRVVCSGEALRPETVAGFFALYGAGPDAPGLFNLYGPTEASIDVTHWRCGARDAKGPVPIGRAVANTSLYILAPGEPDPGGEPLPFGVVGELHIGGVQLATGYLNRPEQTAERFVSHPLAGDGGRLYRTGDLASMREDGVIEYHGRVDQQVKVRGFRIEPGEIESALLALDGVREAVVTAPPQADGSRRLLAHVVAPGVAVESLTEALRRVLPGYMVPSRIVPLDALPMLPNGKVDRRALAATADAVPAEDSAESPVEGHAEGPADESECLVHDAFAEVLRAGRVDVTASFFALGGDSILSLRLRAALERTGRTFALDDLYDDPTVRGLARRLRPYAPGGSPAEPFSLVGPADRELLPEGLEDAYPLSAMQAGMTFHAEYERGTSVYRVVTGVRIRLPFDERLLLTALDGTFRRHPALRCSVHLTGFSEPLQLVHRDVRVPLTVDERLYGVDDRRRDRFLAEWAESAKHHDFDLTAAPLLAFTAHPLSKDSFQLSVVEHHVVLDGWSDAAMIDEIVERYRAALAGEDLWLPEVPSAYRDFVAAERQATRRAEHREFWTRELAGAAHTPLPSRTTSASTGASTGAGDGVRHRRFDVPVDDETGVRVTEAARAAGLPVKSFLAAVHAAVLHSVTPGDEVLTGVVGHGRLETAGADQVIGVFLNTLPLRLAVSGASWRELAERIHAHEQRTAPHRRYPYHRILRDHGDLTLDSYVNFMDFHRRWGSDTAIEDGFGVAETDFPLAANFLVDPVDGRLGLWLDCDVSRLDPEFCRRLAGYYGRALATLAADPAGAPPADLRGRDESARLARWNGPAVPYDTEATVADLIDRQVAAAPDAVALLDGPDRLTYAELSARANRLAHHLCARGAGRGGRVGVSVARSADLVVALLATLRSGAAYVPLDPGFPAERLRYIAADASLDCLITGDGGVADLPARAVVRLETEAAEIASHPADPPRRLSGPDDPVYVIYTSGSTGRPKGTVLLHRNVVNFFTGMDLRIGAGSGDVVLALTSVSFDISVLELLWPLTRGAAVAMAGERMIERLTPADGEGSLCELVTRHGVTLLQATPSFLSAVAAQAEALDALRPLRALLVGGEAFPSGLARRLLTALPSMRVYNMYGPTETTIWSTVHELDREHDVSSSAPPIGTPIANTPVLVVAEDGRETPIGVAGELWIGGDGVAAGYLDRPELTAERFVKRAGRRWYRTGDRVRWRTDGVLEFLGRADRQVKILGHRIEPDEVESVLSRHPEVASVAVVAARRANGTAELVAYVAPVAGRDGGGERAHLERWRDVWEGAYTTDPAADDRDDFAGWMSSYTKKPIPVHEMREWLGHTVRRVADLGARKIVDVGVGVGLYLRELAPHAESYLGIDLSSAALATAAGSVAVGGRLPGHIMLRQGDALTLAELPGGAADLVLFNSVVQYFPGPEYLLRALTEALRVAGPAGAVFVGDVRDLSLLPCFHADTQLHRAPALTPAAEVAAAADRALADERELCLNTDFFTEFAESVGAGVRIELKRGRVANELTRFRWDVTLYGPERALEIETGGAIGAIESNGAIWTGGKQLTWDEVGDLEALHRLLDGTEPERALTVTGLPDRRLVQPLAALALLGERHPADRTAWDLERTLWDTAEPDALDPEDLVAAGEPHGRPVRLVPASPHRVGEFTVLFEPAAGEEPRER